MSKDLEAFLKIRLKKRIDKIPDLDFEKSRREYWKVYCAFVKQNELRDFKMLEINEYEKKFFVNLLKWFIYDDSGDFPSNKSLYIYTGLGTGKTSAAQSLSLYSELLSSRLKNNDLLLKYRSLDEYFIKGYSRNDFSETEKFLSDSWVLDDLKIEHFEYNYYGNKLTLMDDVLTARYSAFSRGERTIITTNINWGQIPNLVSKRVSNRMKQQFIPILLKGDNKRV